MNRRLLRRWDRGRAGIAEVRPSIFLSLSLGCPASHSANRLCPDPEVRWSGVRPSRESGSPGAALLPHLAGTIWKSTLLGRNLNPSVSSTPGRSDDRTASCGRADYGGCDWAWEFLRRNADYIADWRSSVPQQLPCITLRDGTKLLRLRRRFPRAEKWGLHAFADPKLCAHKANVFWHAKALKLSLIHI